MSNKNPVIGSAKQSMFSRIYDKSIEKANKYAAEKAKKKKSVDDAKKYKE
jgi:hypothetical protein